MAPYRAKTGGIFGSGIYPEVNTGLNVGDAIEGLAQAFQTTRDGMIRRAMMQKQLEQQAAQEQRALEDRQFARQQAESQAARQVEQDKAASEERQYKRLVDIRDRADVERRRGEDVSNRQREREEDFKRQKELRTLEAGLRPKKGESDDPMVAQRKIQNASNLRSQFNQDQGFKDAQQAATAVGTVRTALGQQTAAGDMAGIFAYMKALDPGSTVREGEYASAKNAAGVPERVLNAYNNARKGVLLSPQQRADFLNTVEQMAKARRSSLKGTIQRYSKTAEKLGLAPEDVVYDPFSVYDEDAPANPVDTILSRFKLEPKK